jgi:hypothetical protein
MSRKIVIVAAYFCLSFIVYATLCPIHDRPRVFGIHEPHWVAALERLTAFLALGFATSFAFPPRRSFFLILFAAIGLELLQGIVPHRDPRIVDAAIKIVGGMIGMILGHSLIKFRLVLMFRKS